MSAEDEEKTRAPTTFPDGYERREEGGELYTDVADVEAQRALIWDFVKTAGMHLLKGGSLTGIAMPVGLSYPESFLQHIAREHCTAPILLRAAAEAGARGEFADRMLYVMAFVIAGLHRTTVSRARKPFNPILGEIFRGSFFDGTKLYMEQTSHHPPISHWDVEPPGKEWRFTGFSEGLSSFSGNTITTGRKGKQRVTFASDGASVAWTTTFLQVGGIIYGERTQEYRGDLEFTDEQNGLRGTIKLDSDSVKGGWFGGGKKGASDKCSGCIFADPNSESAKYAVASSSEASSKECHESGDVEVASFHGSWVENFVIDSSPALRKSGKAQPRCIWDMSKHCGYEYIPAPDPLPSDSIVRTDILLLASGDMEAAQIEKVRLENLQRADKKLRKASGKSSH